MKIALQKKARLFVGLLSAWLCPDSVERVREAKSYRKHF
jgi:hypothetical protein